MTDSCEHCSVSAVSHTTRRQRLCCRPGQGISLFEMRQKCSRESTSFLFSRRHRLIPQGIHGPVRDGDNHLPPNDPV